MAMTVKRMKDTRVAKVFVHKLADVRGGVSVVTTELSGDYLPEGAVVSAPIDGKSHIVKFAKVVEDVAASGTSIKVAKNHHFKVGDVVFAEAGSAAYAISAINSSNAAYDVLTVGTTLGALSNGAYLFHAPEAGETAGAFKYVPFAVLGSGQPIDPQSNLISDAWVIGVTKGNALPALVANELKGIINY